MSEIEDISLNPHEETELSKKQFAHRKILNTKDGIIHQTNVPGRTSMFVGADGSPQGSPMLDASTEDTPLIPLLDDNGNNYMGFVFDDRDSVQKSTPAPSNKLNVAGSFVNNINATNNNTTHHHDNFDKVAHLGNPQAFVYSTSLDSNPQVPKTNNLFASSSFNGSGKEGDMDGYSDLEDDERSIESGVDAGHGSFDSAGLPTRSHSRIANTTSSTIEESNRRASFRPLKSPKIEQGSSECGEGGGSGSQREGDDGFDDSSVQTNHSNYSNQDSLLGMISDDESISSTSTNYSSSSSNNSNVVSSGGKNQSNSALFSLLEPDSPRKKKHHHGQHRKTPKTDTSIDNIKTIHSRTQYGTRIYHKSLAHLRDFKGNHNIDHLISDHPFENVHVARKGTEKMRDGSVRDDNVAPLELNNYSIHKYHYHHQPLVISQVLPDIKAINSSSNILVFHCPGTHDKSALELSDFNSFDSYDSFDDEIIVSTPGSLVTNKLSSGSLVSGLSPVGKHPSSIMNSSDSGTHSGSGEVLAATLQHQAMVSIQKSDVATAAPTVPTVPKPYSSTPCATSSPKAAKSANKTYFSTKNVVKVTPYNPALLNQAVTPSATSHKPQGTSSSPVVENVTSTSQKQSSPGGQTTIVGKLGSMLNFHSRNKGSKVHPM